jgi:hypothetical protein
MRILTFSAPFSPCSSRNSRAEPPGDSGSIRPWRQWKLPKAWVKRKFNHLIWEGRREGIDFNGICHQHFQV